MTRALLAAALLAGCTTAVQDVAQSYPPGALVITHDPGGQEGAYIARAAQLHATGQPIVIAGRCSSACSILASLPRACIAPGGVVGLHQPFRVWVVGNNRFPMGPNLETRYYQHVTPQIAARVRSLPFSWDNPWHIPYYITHATAPQYGLRRC